MDLRNTHDEVIMSQEYVFKTPNFKVKPNDFVVKRSNCSRDLECSPLPENFANIADEDLWMRLNKGCTTDLDMLQMTPDMKYQSFTSSDTSVVSYQSFMIMFLSYISFFILILLIDAMKRDQNFCFSFFNVINITVISIQPYCIIQFDWTILGFEIP